MFLLFNSRISELFFLLVFFEFWPPVGGRATLTQGRLYGYILDKLDLQVEVEFFRDLQLEVKTQTRPPTGGQN